MGWCNCNTVHLWGSQFESQLGHSCLSWMFSWFSWLLPSKSSTKVPLMLYNIIIELLLYLAFSWRIVVCISGICWICDRRCSYEPMSEFVYTRMRATSWIGVDKTLYLPERAVNLDFLGISSVAFHKFSRFLNVAEIVFYFRWTFAEVISWKIV
jgi:hypothetical protein